ncbi:General negative regulator of transcription subunit 3 [Nosema granulosis]|uniref:General negative regulator of transcription subunit 3 n=1 Tax=Nosema granulosis TaxID=83296 RepID=A0A9P6GWB9_9MICR|nr:General negative regulator of transcription subunit 3 [Nosema granulosis]
MRRNIEKKEQPKNKQEKLTPQQVWKNASMIIGTKKKEQVQAEKKAAKHIDFPEIKSKLRELAEEKIKLFGSKDEFLRIELKNSLFHIPDFSNLEGKYTPKNKVPVPDFFPKQTLNIFESPDIYKKLDIDTLFLIFYTQPNTVQQYYSATQLKLYSWRFHTKYRTWFQRLDEPMLITTDYERGDFLFFDYDVTWSFMKKSDFTFEYKYLECAEL